MQTLSELKNFVENNLPDTLQRRNLINLINNEIERANGDEQSVIFRASGNEAREFIDFKNRKHIVQRIEQPQIKKAFIKLKGNIHPELKRLDIRERDVFDAVIYSSNQSAQFTVRAVGTSYNCTVWPENYDIVLTENK